MVVETESTKCQPVDIESDLYKIVHHWAYLVRHIFNHNCNETDFIFSSEVKYINNS
jgi:hypothetical protein